MNASHKSILSSVCLSIYRLFVYLHFSSTYLSIICLYSYLCLPSTCLNVKLVTVISPKEGNDIGGAEREKNNECICFACIT